MDFSTLLVFKFPYALAFWGVLAWVYTMESIEHKRKSARMAAHSGDDRYSGLVIAVGASVLQVLAFMLATQTQWAVPADVQAPMLYAGVATIAAGMLLRMYCWRVLGNFFTPTVTIASDHKVVDQGPYRFVRHPSYLGALMTLAGVGLALHNWMALCVLMVGSFGIYVYRIEVEEQALERALGDTYAQFKKSRKRLIPFVY
ncbi:isoprenylcysteine carboxylmethyltransferase family protein [Aquabacterium sp.]|uniref:methyltransferase family protein n=1 Tax=Aquabacterium sp. TaxID=1872578 RepID=UPI0025BE53E1|nr:isoprenylcysteine carboxylmethyltransferase family protein [Aquabacterium sp.]